MSAGDWQLNTQFTAAAQRIWGKKLSHELSLEWHHTTHTMCAAVYSEWYVIVNTDMQWYISCVAVIVWGRVMGLAQHREQDEVAMNHHLSGNDPPIIRVIYKSEAPLSSCIRPELPQTPSIWEWRAEQAELYISSSLLCCHVHSE